MVAVLFFAVIVLVLSGLCSMTEAAILSLPWMRARVLADEHKPGAKVLLAVKQDIHTAVATIVILNNAVNIVGSIFVGQMVTRVFGDQWLGVFSGVLTLAIIVFSEIIPKTIGEHCRVNISLNTAGVLYVLMCIFKPFIKVVIFMTKPVRNANVKPSVTEKEIKAMLKFGRHIGTIEVDEETLINRVFKLNDLRARQMMKPIDQICALNLDKTLYEAKGEILQVPFSRIAVYEGEDIRNIRGVCQHRVLLREIANDNYEAKIKEFMLPPIYVNENERADNLLEKFRFYNQHLFFVVDRFRKIIGIITMEDILEELFGEILDEKDAAVTKPAHHPGFRLKMPQKDKGKSREI